MCAGNRWWEGFLGTGTAWQRPRGCWSHPFTMAPAQPPTLPFPDPCISQGLSHTPLRSKGPSYHQQGLPLSELPWTISLAPASPVKSVCTGVGRKRQVRPTVVGPFFHLQVLRDGAGLALPHWQSQVLALALLTRGPATQQLPHQPLPCLPHLVPRSQTVVNKANRSRWARGVLKCVLGPWGEGCRG